MIRDRIREGRLAGREMSSALLPEFFAILGTDIFLAMSLLTCLLDRYVPKAVPYVYQIVALAGFGHLLISKNFLTIFGEYMRFWYCFFYLLVALANVVAINIYLAASRKLWNLAKTFAGAVTVPATLTVAFFLSNYVGQAAYPLVSLPQIPLEFSYLAIVTFDVAVIAIGLSAFFSLRRPHLALICFAIILGTGICTFVKPPGWYLVVTASAVVLGVACGLILSTSLYLFITTQRKTPKKSEGR